MTKKKEAPKKMGRKRIELEDINVDGWKLLDSLVLWSAHAEYIADELGMSEDTLSKRIKEKTGLTFTEYRHKRKEKLRTTLSRKQYEVAMGGNVTMLIWLGKNELGQKDKHETEVNSTTSFKINIEEYGKDS